MALRKNETCTVCKIRKDVEEIEYKYNADNSDGVAVCKECKKINIKKNKE